MQWVPWRTRPSHPWAHRASGRLCCCFLPVRVAVMLLGAGVVHTRQQHLDLCGVPAGTVVPNRTRRGVLAPSFSRPAAQPDLEILGRGGCCQGASVSRCPRMSRRAPWGSALSAHPPHCPIWTTPRPSCVDWGPPRAGGQRAGLAFTASNDCIAPALTLAPLLVPVHYVIVICGRGGQDTLSSSEISTSKTQTHVVLFSPHSV